MGYSRGQYAGAAYGGTVEVPAASGAPIVDPTNPGGSGWTIGSAITGSGPYAGFAYGGGGGLVRPASGGISATPDPLLGQVRLSAWWSDAPYLRVVRIVKGVRTPVRGAYPAPVTTTTRRNRCTNPSAEVDTTGWLSGTNTTLTRIVEAAMPAGVAAFRLKATAAGAVNATVPVALPLPDGAPCVSLALRLSAAPSGALTVSVAWRDASNALLATTTATIAAGSLTGYVNRWGRTPVLTVPYPGLGAGAAAIATGVMTISVAGMAANATADLDAVLIEGGSSSGDYFDGSTPNANTAWAGTPHASVSTQAGVVSLVDTEAPLDVPIRYELSAPDQPAFRAISEPVTLDSGGRTWLTHPYSGASVVVTVAEEPDQTRAISRGVFEVIGRARPIAINASQRQSSSASLTVWTETFAERDALLAMLDDGTPLLLRAPAELGHGDGEWLSIGDVQYKVVGHGAWEHTREFTLPYVVVDAPPADDTLAVA
ncbi:hypothetical protein [Pseudonocardia sp. D17]|uniref:hypothetical protein n=1 Tax=Pseudonocardia sp. D17 TaxID=882661 RepID=UPI002B3B1D53|nr:hypothetical protein PSD17_39190 [Pseudonocardia sp. D17]